MARDTNAPHDTLDVQAALVDLDRRWRGPFAADARPLRVHAEPGLPRPGASPAATRQVLDVLVDNALRHGRGEVRVTARATRDAVAIDVADQGPGIPSGRADPFERRTDGATGHGIGLALAQSLAEAEGGRLVLARRAPGAEFTLLLPITAAGA